MVGHVSTRYRFSCHLLVDKVAGLATRSFWCGGWWWTLEEMATTNPGKGSDDYPATFSNEMNALSMSTFLQESGIPSNICELFEGELIVSSTQSNCSFRFTLNSVA